MNHEIQAIQTLYAEIDARIDAFKRATGFDCVPLCGHCCKSDEVEATVLEMLPLAGELCRTEPDLHALVEKLATRKQCIFCAHDGADGSTGCCTIYPWRGLMCRLFGFSYKQGKDGKKQFAACIVLKEQQPQTIAAIREKLACGAIDMPGLTEYHMRLLSIHPEWGRTLYPFNEAIRRAIEIVALRQRFEGEGA